jgi:methionyl-tRNA formyltransferase
MERVVFFGSPDFAVPALEALVSSEFRPVLVVTQPDRPAGRGRQPAATPVRRLAETHGITVLVLESFRAAGVLDRLREETPDFCVVVSFGKIFPGEALRIARKGNVNLHASLLPAYRGASPINRAIVNGESWSGLTTMEMEEALDAGPIYLQRMVPIGPLDTAGAYAARLAVEGAPLLIETLRRISGEGLRPVPQPADGVSTAPLLRKEDGIIPWDRDAVKVHDHIRGMNPWPGSFTYYRGDYLKILDARPFDLLPREAPPGCILRAQGDTIIVGCGRGSVQIGMLQAEGRRPLEAARFLRGYSLAEREILGKRIDG